MKARLRQLPRPAPPLVEEMADQPEGSEGPASARGRLPRPVPLALLAPLAFLAGQAHMPMLAFPLSVLALVGAAFLLGEAVEVASRRLGEGVGSLATATMSNMVTLSILTAALLEGLYDVVRGGIVGAILGNILFALGGAMILGGITREKQSFGREAAASQATLLLVASFAFLLPALVGVLGGAEGAQAAAQLTLPLSGLLLGVYGIGLLFAMRTHKHLFNAKHGDPDTQSTHPVIARHALPVLAGSVVLVALMAETLAETLGPLGTSFGLPQTFLGIAVIGVVANSVEIASTWRMARRDHMNVSIQVATGSGTQVMLFVAPLLVLVSLFLPTGLLSLELPLLMAAVMGMGAVLVNVVASDGESTWYEGVLLVALWAMFALMFLYVG